MGEEAGQEQSPSFNDSTTANSPSGFTCGLVGAIVTMLVIVLLLYVYEKPPLQPIRTSKFCCPQVLKEIFSGVNQSIDPCRSIFDHTCYAYVATRDGYTELPAFNKDPVDGVATTEAGRAVAAYHRACLAFGEVETASHGGVAADVILNVTRPPKASPESRHLVFLIVELSLKYGLPSLLRFDVEPGDRFTLNLMVSPPPLVSLPDKLSASMLAVLKATALEVVNHYFSLKHSLQEVDAFLTQITGPVTNTTKSYTLESFGHIHSELAVVRWEEIVGALDVIGGVIIHGVSVERLKDTLDHILKQRVPSLVSALVSASTRLASRLVMGASTSEARSLECHERANELLPLVVLDRISYFRSKSQDYAILEAFRIIAEALLSKTKSGMSSDDFRRLATTLNSTRVSLPSQVIPEDLAIPTMTSNYARAELLAHAYVLRSQRHQMVSLGVSEGFAKHFLGKAAIFAEGVFVVPTLVYTSVSLANVTDPLLLASTVGVYIADALWDFVFKSDWGPVSNAVLREYGNCIQDNSRSLIEWPSQIMWLSLSTSIDAARDADWDSVVVHPAGAREMTRGRLFYMSFVHYILCRGHNARLDSFGWDVNIFMSAFGDFYRSFRCDMTVSKLTGDVCPLHLSNNTA